MFKHHVMNGYWGDANLCKG